MRTKIFIKFANINETWWIKIENILKKIYFKYLFTIIFKF